MSSRVVGPASLKITLMGVAILLSAIGCQRTEPNASPPLDQSTTLSGGETPPTGELKIGVLLVSHGSHSAEWRSMLTKFGDSVTPDLVAIDGIQGVKSAFMEYTEPSIATQLKEFDQEGYDRVILAPLLLTVSSHSFDDIPTIVGAKEDAKSLLMLESEGIELYTPKAEVSITPLLDFSELLLENLPRRIAALSQKAEEEGVVLVAYGSEPFNQEWESFFARIDEAVQKSTGVAEVTHCWCGHIAHYSGEPTKQAIHGILSRCERAIVVPVLVARDETFQGKIIGGAVNEMEERHRVAYTGDAILPDERLNEWVVSIAKKHAADMSKAEASEAEAQP